jgi:hypothetical protein
MMGREIFMRGVSCLDTPASGFPASNGAFQTSFQGGGRTGEPGGFDMAIIKFDPSGSNRVYALILVAMEMNNPIAWLLTQPATW